MDDIASLAQKSLENSGLKLKSLTQTQREEVLAAIQEKIKVIQDQKPAIPGAVSFFSINFACIACEAGLNVLGGAAIAAAIVAGVAVAATAPWVAAIAAYFGVEAAGVATVINGALGGGGGATVEGVIATLCENFGACNF